MTTTKQKQKAHYWQCDKCGYVECATNGKKIPKPKGRCIGCETRSLLAKKSK